MRQKNIYLVAQYYMKPKERVNTTVKGWMDNPDNIRWDEKVEIVRGLRKKDLHAKIVVNLSNKKVDTNNFNGNKDFDSIFQYFFTGYSKYITQVMGQLDPMYLQTMVDTMQADLDTMPPDENQIVDVPAQVISETLSSK